jgi:Xaa-Pro aminopeptidase
MDTDSLRERQLAWIAYLFGENKLDALLISRGIHIRYLTGFTGSNALLLATNRGMYFITDGRYEAQAEAEVRGCTVVVAKRGLLEEIRRRRFLRNACRIGFESKHTVFDSHRALKKLFPGRRWIALSASIEPLMLQKSESEIACIRAAVEISERVFTEVLDMIRPGAVEREIAAELSYRHRRYGADRDAFEPIVASGSRAALPHGRATDKKISYHESVILDFGCVVGGYHCDITRTVAVGDPGTEFRRCYAAVRDALRRAADAVRDGLPCKRLDRLAREVIGNAGYGEYFTHSLGHGIGLDIHELPRISAYSNERFVAGSAVTIEPGIYIPGAFGVRIEDDMLITEDGCQRLTSLSHEMITVE